MELPTEYHPQELLRHVRLFYENLVTDLDLRFPEARKRRAYELSLEGLGSNTEPVLKEFESLPNKVISILDWPLLLEWNERWQQAQIISALHSELMKASPSATEVVRILKLRLKEIQQAFRNFQLQKEPSLWELFAFRWKFSCLREEAWYLLGRLRDHESGSSSWIASAG